ncbi:MAG: hypothetical protein GAK28_02421 [Luteibacter sp.]|uniref:phage recombination protein Bet n=1 Tax=Luteibacter sp. TaxID=1886636 RepID=UPI001385C778|nr:MAG: hypothetical protein GAK28_02421 [Luteibacter sp.]
MIVVQASALAKSLSIEAEPQELVTVLKATAFKGQVSDAQMMALLVVSNQYGLNPWTKEIYAFPDKNNGIVPVVGVDGWSRIINTNDQFDGMEFEYGPLDGKHHEWIECIIYRKDRSRPTRVREYWDEVYRNGIGPWQSHGKRMHRHKATIQCARLAFGFVGIYDQDEAERIIEGDYKVVGNRPGIAAVERTVPEDSPERDLLIADLNAVSDNGMDALMKEWERIGKPSRQLVADRLEGFKERASRADSIAAGNVATDSGEVQ